MIRKLAVWALVATALLAPALAALPADAAPAPAPVWLRLSLHSLNPSVVTATSTSVTVTGTITNISDRRISDITARLQLAEPVSDGADISADLSPTAVYSHSDTVFVPVIGSLAPGQSTPFTVHESLRGSRSLQVTDPGVYPLMINMQGVPDFSTAYRLVVGTMLLPVLSTPGVPAPPPGRAGKLTVLWPLVDTRPRVVGTDDGRPVLSDDALAASLSPGGRLFGLVDAVKQAATTNQQVLATLCFAVDPDLLATVRAMTGGYRVRVGDRTVVGTGTTVATDWLAALKTLTQGNCVLPLPYADADLAALAHANGTGLVQSALGQSAATSRSLGAAGDLADVAWPADGALDTRTMTDIAGLGVNTVLLDQSAVTPPAGGTPVSLAGFTGGAAPKVVPVDDVVAGAMAPRTDEPTVDNAGISVQDGLAATLYQTVFGGAEGRPVLVAPPRRWSPTESQATAFLSATGTMLTGHYATAASLADAVSAVPSGPPARLSYPQRAARAEVNHAAAAEAVRADGQQRDLQSAMSRDHTKPDPVLPSQLINPLRLGLLRGVSSAWRDTDGAGATAALADTSRQFESLTQQVGVVQPNLPILLGSKDSKLPVTVNNGLPVDMTVRVDLTGDPGLPSGSKDDIIPAGSSVTVFIATSVTRSGRISAYATVRTLGGTQLGQQARLELVSSAYGTIIVIVTAIAFGLLVLLSGRRIYRRVRASRAAEATRRPGEQAVGALVGAGEPADRHANPADRREPDQR